MPRRRHVAALIGVFTVMYLTVSGLYPDTWVGYLLRASYYQAELLWGRVPLDVAARSTALTPEERLRLEQVADIKAFGASIGLSATDNYETINPTWRRTVWNLSACEPLAFRSVVWRFPIVGSVPYLGFFRTSDASFTARRLRRGGYDVEVRPAGAYSTLGWFRDPLLPTMLRWDEARLAATLLHELAHATLWIRGSVAFNESFATFVGYRAHLRYLKERYGIDSDPYRHALHRHEDAEVYRAFMQTVYVRLQQLYDRPDLSDATKRLHKQLLFAGLPRELAQLPLHERERYVRAGARIHWNNARIAQFRTYNDHQEEFATILRREGGDLRRFIDAIDAMTSSSREPEEALARATRGR